MPDARFQKPGDITPDMPEADRLMMENPQCWPTPGGFGIGTLERSEDGSLRVDMVQPPAPDNGLPTMQGKLLALRRIERQPTDDLGVLLAPGLGEAPFTIIQTPVMDGRLHELVHGERSFESLLDERDFMNPERELGVHVYDRAEDAVIAGWRVD